MTDEDQPAPSAVPSDANSLDARRRRALFRATHRGTKEADQLLGGYVAPLVGHFTAEELDALETLMALPDVDLADWLTGRRPPPPEHDTTLLRAIAAAAGTSRKT